jgi:hypothetical protein
MVPIQPLNQCNVGVVENKMCLQLMGIKSESFGQHRSYFVMLFYGQIKKYFMFYFLSFRIYVLLLFVYFVCVCVRVCGGVL